MQLVAETVRNEVDDRVACLESEIVDGQRREVDGGSVFADDVTTQPDDRRQQVSGKSECQGDVEHGVGEIMHSGGRDEVVVDAWTAAVVRLSDAVE